MKINKVLAAIMLFFITTLTACYDIPPFIPNGPGPGIDDPIEVDSADLAAPDTIGWNIPAEAITVAQAREICAGLASGATSGTKYYVMGYVKKLHSKHESGVADFGNAQFYMEDVKNANSSNDFMAYQVYGPNGSRISDPNVVAVGDFVVVYGELTNYNGTYETVGRGAAHIWKSTNALLNGEGGGTGDSGDDTPDISTEAPDTIGWNIPATAITVAQAREICAGLASGATTGKKYYVMGYVKKLHNNHASGVSGFGNATFYMIDANSTNANDDFMAYQVYGPNGEKITNPDVVAVGDFVVVYGELTNYMGNTYETVGKGAAYIWRSTNPLLAGQGGGTEPEPEPEPEGPELTGSGTETDPFTADDVIALNNSKPGMYFIKAYIVGQINGTSSSNAEFEEPFSKSINKKTGKPFTYNTNILIAASATEKDVTKCVSVQLPSGALRDGLNLPENPEMLGKEVLILGSLEEYLGLPGIRSPQYAEAGDEIMGAK